MPPPSNTAHLPPSHPANRQKPKSPNRVLAEAEAQWLFTEAELANTPSIQDGMGEAEERDIRAKGVNFIVQVGIMLKLPQLTLSTAAIFFQRFLMRASLKKERGSIPKLHHYQAAATALFLATKVEESCRKMKELILAFCRVAQKNPNLIIDEQSKDWWRWRDCILYNEDVLLETLCFDLTVESPHRQLFELLKWYGVEHNKRLRNQAWAFVTDANNTQLCLLCTSRTIAVAALYAACKHSGVALPDDKESGRPWWDTQHVRLKDVQKAINYMCANYAASSGKVNGTTAPSNEGEQSIYQGLTTPIGGAAEDWDATRQKADAPPAQSRTNSRRNSNASSAGVKRDREDDAAPTNGGPKISNGLHAGTIDDGSKRQRLDPSSALDSRNTKESRAEAKLVEKGEATDAVRREEALRVEGGNEKEEAGDKAAVGKRDASGATSKPTQEAEEKEDGEASEEGEVEE